MDSVTPLRRTRWRGARGGRLADPVSDRLPGGAGRPCRSVRISNDAWACRA